MSDEPIEGPAAAGAESTPRPRRRLMKATISLVVVLVAILGWNATVALPVMSALSGESSHGVVIYRRWLVSPNSIVFDVWKPDPEGSMADMDRLLFKAAEALKDKHFDQVLLAYHGSGKFLLDGQRFQTIGQTYAVENPVYLMRTLTESVSDMDGKPAFGTWTGGLLGVLGQQLNDQNELHKKWWVEPALGGQ